MRFLVLLLLALPSFAQAGLIEEQGPLEVGFGQGRQMILDALIVRPDDGEKRPLVLLNHGAPRDVAARSGMNPRAMLFQAREFARRGWVAVSFMRRGYGESEGPYAEAVGRCADPDYRNAALQSAQDLRGVIQAMKRKPYVDGTRIVSVGRSAGGFATVALTADPPPGLLAAISFAGGRGSQKVDEVCAPDRLIEAFGDFGRRSRVPMLWVYSENDHYFGPKLARSLHQAFSRGGGKAELVVAPAFGEDGHMLFSRTGAAIWAPIVDAFLARHELKLVDRLLAVRDAPKGLNQRGQDSFARYVDEPGQKAFAMSADGAYGWRSGQKEPKDAAEAALGNCRKAAQKPCRIIMVNDDWAQ